MPTEEPDARAAGMLLADEVRGLIADMHRIDPPADRLEAALGLVAAARAELGDTVRLRWYEVPDADLDDAARSRLRQEHRDHSLYRGGRNPLAVPMEVSRGTDGDGREVVVGLVRADRGREGPPGRVHGGFVAGLFDDVLSGVAGLAGASPAVTARLGIRYRRPTPIDADLRFEARVERHSGRRLVARATCVADGRVTAEAEALFVTVAPPPAEG